MLHPLLWPYNVTLNKYIAFINPYFQVVSIWIKLIFRVLLVALLWLHKGFVGAQPWLCRILGWQCLIIPGDFRSFCWIRCFESGRVVRISFWERNVYSFLRGSRWQSKVNFIHIPQGGPNEFFVLIQRLGEGFLTGTWITENQPQRKVIVVVSIRMAP